MISIPKLIPHSMQRISMNLKLCNISTTLIYTMFHEIVKMTKKEEKRVRMQLCFIEQVIPNNNHLKPAEKTALHYPWQLMRNKIRMLRV